MGLNGNFQCQAYPNDVIPTEAPHEEVEAGAWRQVPQFDAVAERAAHEPGQHEHELSRGDDDEGAANGGQLGVIDDELRRQTRGLIRQVMHTHDGHLT